MVNKSIRIILDTNLWISFLISNNFDKLTQLLLSNRIKLLFSNELLEEFLNVVNMPKLRKYFSKTKLSSLMQQVNAHAEFVEVTSIVNDCRDIKDNFLLALAIDGNADFLLTGDKDLLVLNPYRSTKILTLTEFYGTL